MKSNADAFYHQYQYDAENRLTKVRTSRDRVYWQNDATYSYYRHGPLARMELGDLSVQGVDYAYTLQGWLKSINPSNVNIAGDLYDADGTSSIPLFERDAYKLNLNYYDDGTYTDYMPINAPTGYVLSNGLPSAAKYNLYNGNIGSMAVSLRSVTNMAQIYNYRYDQLNRIMSMDAWDANGSFATTGTIPKPDYKEQYSYDPNGNILTLLRNGTTANSSSLAMDNLTYKYKYVKTGGGIGEYTPGQAPTTNVDHLTNQLSSVQDGVDNLKYANDIDNQPALNYSYDAIGNLTKDDQAKITNIVWSVYGKILSITKEGAQISYTYDASGNRITKTVGTVTTSYVRDAQGNVLSVYVQGNTGMNGGAITQSEVNIYGSSRLGVLNSVVNCSGTNLVASAQSVFTRGTKLFELSNHLGNVLVTVSDKKIQHTTDNLTVDYYTPDVASANDYYPGGMQMPGRTYTSGSSSYRYGFNGKELDPDMDGNNYDYGFRIYNPQIGKFLSVDPHSDSYPCMSGYSAMGNNPISIIDPDGQDIVYFNINGKETYRVKSTTEFRTFIQSTASIKPPAQSLAGWKEVPMPKIVQERTQSKENTTGAEYQSNDYLIAARTGLFNQTKNNGNLQLYTENGNPIPKAVAAKMTDLDPTIVKAASIQESNNGVGGNNDLLTANNKGDYDAYKKAYGVTKDEEVTDANRSLYLGIRYLATKGFRKGVFVDSKTGATSYTFQGWLRALGNYNGFGVEKFNKIPKKDWKFPSLYEGYINTMVKDSKTPTSANY